MKIITSVLMLLTLTGCSFGYTAYADDLILANEQCRSNDGVRELDVRAALITVYCNNNASFDNVKKKGE